MRFFPAAEEDDPVVKLMEKLDRTTVQVQRVLELNKTPELEKGFQALMDCRNGVEHACATTPAVSSTNSG